MSVLVLAFHHAPAAVAALRAALDAGGITGTVLGRVSRFPGLSSAYAAEAVAHRRGDRILPHLARSMGLDVASKIEDYDHVVLVTWSAGYKLAQAILELPEDAKVVSAWVALDSGYGPIGSGEVAFAKRAAAGGAVLSVAYTDVPTSGYASSGEHARALVAAVGGTSGGFVVDHLAHDPSRLSEARRAGAQAVIRFWEGEHVRAIGRGPVRMLDALRQLQGEEASASPPTEREPPPPALRVGDTGARVKLLQAALNLAGAVPQLVEDGKFGPKTEVAVVRAQRAQGLDPSGAADEHLLAALAQRATWCAAILAAARADLALGVRETRHNDGDDLRELYFDPVGVAPGQNWCALAAWSWLRRAAAQLGREMPIAGSAAAKAWAEQFLAAQRRGVARWIPKAQLTDADVVPGVICVWDRSERSRPETAWWGHIGVCVTASRGRAFETIEGNSGPDGDRVALMARTGLDPRLLGVGVLIG